MCTLVIAVVQLKWASPDVRSNAGWVFLYAMGGAAWLRLGLFLLSLLGIGVREDVLERQNPAAAWVVFGTLIGTALCYAGATVGSGSGAEFVFFCAALSTAFLFCFWLCLEIFFQLADRVTVDRDESAGIRVAGWMTSLGLIFGAAVAGDWQSLEGTVRDFARYAWVTFVFLLAAVATEWAFKLLQKQKPPYRGASVAISAGYFVAAVIYVAWRGVR